MKLFKPFFLFVCLFLGWSNSTTAQAQSYNKSITIIPNSISICVDSFPIIKESFQIQDVEPQKYQIDWLTATLHLLDSSLLHQPLTCSYRTFSFQLTQKQQHKNHSLITNPINTYSPKPYTIDNLLNSSQNDHNMISSGSISRGFTIGNKQDFNLNSNLNLQLSGFLAEDLEIKANITDKNVPIQPEGNTRVIQDFNQIFITLKYKNQWIIDAGDISIENPQNLFLVVNKKITGMKFTAENHIKQKFKLTNNAGGGIAKGKYYRQKLSITNGMQGPYRLTGPQNNASLIIISGSEKVYLDNKLLTRGANEDYTINYNTGEITFTSKILITSEKEINIEYEYSDLAYAHYSLFSFNEFSSSNNPNLKLSVNFFHDQDLKNRSIQPELTNNMMHFLANLSNENNAQYPFSDSIPFSTNEILYRRIDTLVNGTTYESIYEYSTNQQIQLYRLNFTFVGPNKGNYILSVTTSNGRVFQWIAPVNNIPQGDYEPVILLTTPTLSQMATIGIDYKFTQNSGVKADFAFSNHIDNTFNSGENQKLGGAFNINIFHNNKLITKRNPENQWMLQSNLNYEMLSKGFQPIENYRNIEFYKDFNLTNIYSDQNSEQMLEANLKLIKPNIHSSTYKFTFYNRLLELNAIRNEFSSITTKNGFLFNTQNSILNTQDSTLKTLYIRTFNTFSKKWKKLETGIHERFELNLFDNVKADSLLNNSFLLNETYWFLNNVNNKYNIYNLIVKNIVRQKTENSQLFTSEISSEAQVNLELTQIKSTKINLTATYRNSQLKDSIHLKYNNENYFLGKIEYTGRYFKNSLILSTFYEAGSGLEQKRLFSFLKVNKGQGTHIWNDYNNDNVEDLNEFEIANYQDEADYIKIWANSNEYINTYNNQFTQIVQLRPANLWKNRKGFLHWLSRFSNNTSLRIDEKNKFSNIFKAVNPFNFNITDTSLISSSVNLNNNLSFNQTSPYWGIDYWYKINQNKILNYYGSETAENQTHEIMIHGNPHKSIIIKTIYNFSTKKNSSEYFLTDNYHIYNRNIKTLIQLQLKNRYFSTLLYEYSYKNNQNGNEKCSNHAVTADFNYRLTNKGMLNMHLKYAHLKYWGNSQNAVGFEMLDGLKNGHNILWTCTLQIKVTEYLQLDVSYDGRAATHTATTHTGNIKLKAFF